MMRSVVVAWKFSPLPLPLPFSHAFFRVKLSKIRSFINPLLKFKREYHLQKGRSLSYQNIWSIKSDERRSMTCFYFLKHGNRNNFKQIAENSCLLLIRGYRYKASCSHSWAIRFFCVAIASL